MKKNLLVIALIFLSINCIYSQQMDYADLDTNNVRARIWSNGNHFWDHQGISYFNIPKSPAGLGTIFTHDIWIGGKDPNQMVCFAGNQYSGNGEDFFPGPVSNYYDSTSVNNWRYVWKITKNQVLNHINWSNNPSNYPNYNIPNVILNWPAHGDTLKGQDFYLAPFVDVDNDGIYNPDNGDYPKIKGDMAIWYILNDDQDYHSETGGPKMKIQMKVMAYAYYCNGCAGNTVYMNYQIKNKSNHDFTDTRIGFFTDFDIGRHLDDLIGSDVSRGAYYAYNSSSYDDKYGNNPPAQGVVILKGVKMPDNNKDDPGFDSLNQQICDESINGIGFGDGIIDNEYSGLYGFVSKVRFNQSTYPILTDSFYMKMYRLLGFKWYDNTNVVHSGTGWDTIGNLIPTRFMFPGLSDPCSWGTNGVQDTINTNWTDTTLNNQPSDRRGHGVLKPFTFVKNETQEIDIAFVYARNSVNFSIDTLFEAIDSIRYYYNYGLHPCSGQPLAIKKENKESVSLNIYPNPAEESVNIEINSNSNLEYHIYNITGKLISKGVLENNKPNSINISDFPKGILLIKVSGGNQLIVKKLIHL